MKNEKHLCTVGSDDVWMFSAGVSGDIWGSEASELDINGGSKRRQGGESDFLIWQMPNDLVKGDRVAFFFEEGSASNPMGTIFDETAPAPVEPKIKMSFPPTDEELKKLESRPAANADLKWSFSASGAPAIEISPDLTRQHVSLHFLWNEERPQRLRVSLSKKSLREIFSRSGGEELFLEYVPVGASFEIRIEL